MIFRKGEVLIMSKVLVAYFSASGVTGNWQNGMQRLSEQIYMRFSQRFHTRMLIWTGWIKRAAAVWK